MFEVLDEVCTPSMATKYSAGIDLRAREDVTIYAGETVVIPLGVKIDLEAIYKLHSLKFGYRTAKSLFGDDRMMAMMRTHYLALHIRSGLAVKGLVQNNGTGVVDMDYPDELGLIVSYPVPCVTSTGFHPSIVGRETLLQNTIEIKKGDRVAQAILMEHKNYLSGYSSDTERSGGYGSTGK